jgi:hypothetical protein
MALGLAPGVANSFLNALCRAVNYTAPTTIWVQLHVADPGAAGTANLAAETNRKQITFGSAAAGGSISNTAVVTWTGIAGSQDASHYSLWDASSAGTFLGSGLITANAYTAGDTYNMAIGAIVLSFGVAA